MKKTGCLYDVLTYFDICVDIIADMGTGEPKYGQAETIINRIEIMLGGSACIFASQCAKLGLIVKGSGIIGDDHFGSIAKHELELCGVDVSGLAVSKTLGTSAGLHLCKSNDRAILTDDRSIRILTANSITDGDLRCAKHLHIASSYLLTGLHEGLPNVLHKAKNYGLTVSLDTNWDPSGNWLLPLEILRRIDIFFPNETEAILLSGKKSADEAAEYFLEYVPTVVIKKGPDGADLYQSGKKYSAAPPKVDVVDTIGAGDSFDAGFLFGFLNGYTPELSLKSAVYCGSMNTAEAGGCKGQARSDQLKKYLDTLK